MRPSMGLKVRLSNSAPPVIASRLISGLAAGLPDCMKSTGDLR
jgi:hypothetical protein